MKKVIIGVFAHPDDEAFGPSATLLMESQTGSEIHLVTLTGGEAGMNPDNLSDLGSERLREWKKAGELIGATKMYHFGYADGELGNNDHIHITKRLETLVQTIAGDRDDIEIEFMSMDLNGITGHIDHIVAGRSACLAFYRLRAAGLPMTKVRLACIPSNYMTAMNTDFVFMESGHTPDEISETVDARHLASRIHEIIRCHYTQRSDSETHIARLGDDVALNHFIVRL